MPQFIKFKSKKPKNIDEIKDLADYVSLKIDSLRCINSAMIKAFFQFIVFFLLLTFSTYSKNYEKIIINGNERISNETILVY